MQNTVSVLENGKYKLIWDFDIQTDHLIAVSQTCKIVDSAVPTDHRIKLKENEKKCKYLDLAR